MRTWVCQTGTPQAALGKGHLSTGLDSSASGPTLEGFFCVFVLWLHWVFIALYRLSLVADSRGLLFVAVHGLLIAVASLVAEHGL